MAAKLKKGDNVVVLAGKDKGQKGEISSVNPSANKAVVEGVNVAIRHTKQTQASQGGRLAKADADRPVEPGAAGQERQSNPRRLPHGRRQEGSFRQNHRGGHLMLDQATYTPRLKADYIDPDPCRADGRIRLQERHAMPRLDKIVLNMGVGEAVKDTKKVKQAAEELTLIAGQKAVITHAKNSIAGFRVREADAAGLQGDPAWRPDV